MRQRALRHCRKLFRRCNCAYIRLSVSRAISVVELKAAQRWQKHPVRRLFPRGILRALSWRVYGEQGREISLFFAGEGADMLQEGGFV